MKILFLEAYYAPEIFASSHLEEDLVNELVAQGHRITVICPTPTRSIDDKTRNEYKSRKKEYTHDGHVEIIRFWAPREKKSPIIRALRYFWCNWRTHCIAIKQKKIDIVFSNSTPPTQGAVSASVAKKFSKKYKREIPFIYHLQDVFPDSLISAGLTKKGSSIWKIGRKIEDYTYRNVEKIIAISKGFKENLINKGVTENKIEIVSNWIDLTAVYPIPREKNTLIVEFHIDPEKFIIVYAGNFGEAQGADIVLDLAEKLSDKKEIQFVIFGGGTYFDDAKSRAQNMDNVIINELLPKDRISEVYSLGDIALITCKKGTGKTGLPSKLWSIMACNTPIIASFDMDSDLCEILKSSKCGTCVEAENVNALVDEVQHYYSNIINSTNGREYVELFSERGKSVGTIVALIENCKTE